MMSTKEIGDIDSRLRPVGERKGLSWAGRLQQSSHGREDVIGETTVRVDQVIRGETRFGCDALHRGG